MQISSKQGAGQASHQLYVIRLSSETANHVEPVIEGYRKSVFDAIAKLEADNPRSLVRTQKKLRDLRGTFSEYSKEVRDSIYAFAAVEMTFQAGLLESVFIEDVFLSIPERPILLKAIRDTPLVLNGGTQTFQEMLASFDADTQRLIMRKVTGAYFNGDIAGLRKVVDKDIAMRERQIKSTVRTLYQHAASVTKQTLYRDNSDIVIGYQIIATLDSRTTRICVIRDREIYLYKDTFNPKLPFHYNERSADIPVLSDKFAIDETGATRAARGDKGGQEVQAKTTTLSFAKNQSAEFQDDLLGPVRGKIFRNAGLSTDEFHRAMKDQFDRPISIEQMMAKDKKIMKYMEDNPELLKFV